MAPRYAGGRSHVNTAEAQQSLSDVRPGERVDLLFVVSAALSHERLMSYGTVAERMAVYDSMRAEALEPLIAAIRRRRGMEIVNDSRDSGHLLVRGNARDFTDETTGLLSEIRDLPVEIYPNDRVMRAI
jgi:hypothetical protein